MVKKQMTAGKAVVESLRAEGVRYAFGIVGSTFEPIVREMYGLKDFTFVSTRHEQGATMIADGYARVTGLPAVVMPTSGPGVTNITTGVYAAKVNHVPMIVVAGCTSNETVGRDVSQEVDHIAMLRPITKAALHVTTAERIPETIRHAFRLAMSGQRGPVYVEVPVDLLHDQDVGADIQAPQTYRLDHRPHGDPERVRQAVDVIKSAQRPVIVAGSGICHSGATREVVELAERLSIPVVAAFQATDAFPNDNPLFVGMMAYSATRVSPEAAELVRKADLVIGIGARLGNHTMGAVEAEMAPGVKYIQIDIEGKEIGRFRPIAAGVQGDAKAVVRQLLDQITRQGFEGGYPEWRRAAEGLRAARQKRLDLEGRDSFTPVRPQRAYAEIRKVLPSSAIKTFDAGTAPALGYERLTFTEPRTLLSPGIQMGLGVSYPLGLGAKLGRPDLPVVSFNGDGGFLYNAQELETAVREKVPVIAVVMNNNEWGSEKVLQARNAGVGKLVGTEITNPRFDKLAELYGAKGYYCSRPGDIGDALVDAMVSGRPAVIEIPIASILDTFPK